MGDTFLATGMVAITTGWVTGSGNCDGCPRELVENSFETFYGRPIFKPSFKPTFSHLRATIVSAFFRTFEVFGPPRSFKQTFSIFVGILRRKAMRTSSPVAAIITTFKPTFARTAP